MHIRNLQTNRKGFRQTSLLLAMFGVRARSAEHGQHESAVHLDRLRALRVHGVFRQELHSQQLR